jgi:hypothetical protein
MIHFLLTSVDFFSVLFPNAYSLMLGFGFKNNNLLLKSNMRRR